MISLNRFQTMRFSMAMVLGLGLLSQALHASNVGHSGASATVSNTPSSGVRAEKKDDFKLPDVKVNRNKVLEDVSEAEALAQARSTCESMLNDQAWVFYGFWASERNASDLQMNFPNDLAQYSMRHLEHSIACKRVETRAHYGVRNHDPQKSKHEERAKTALIALAPAVGLLTLFGPPTLRQNEREAIAIMEAVCEPRPEEERQILKKLHQCSNTDKKIAQTQRFAKNAASRGDQEQLNSYLKEIQELEANRPEGCAHTFEEARRIKVTEFVKAPLDACELIQN